MRLTGAGCVPRTIPPLLLRAAAVMPTAALRIDIHPGDLDHPRRMLALEWALAHSTPGRAPVTYEDLAARASASSGLKDDAAETGRRGRGRRALSGPGRGAQGSTPPAVPAAIIDAER